jgi:hypothetical protein
VLHKPFIRYVSYFATGYCRIFLQYAGNNMKRARKAEAEYVVPSKLMLFYLEFGGRKLAYFLQVDEAPCYF